jgi:predicted HTH domain antitoxin
METVTLELKVPKELLSLGQKSRADMEREAQISLAVELFRQREVSAGKAAEIAGVSLRDFMDLTNERGVDWLRYTPEELAQELEEAIALGNRLKRERG